jgi:hypothetical protein
MKTRDQLEDLGVLWLIILKGMLKEQGGRMWAGFISGSGGSYFDPP